MNQDDIIAILFFAGLIIGLCGGIIQNELSIAFGWGCLSTSAMLAIRQHLKERVNSYK